MMCERFTRKKIQNDSTHLKHGFDRMYEMMEQEKFCDLDVVIGSESYSVHSVVMAAFSEYFYNLDQNCSKGSRTRIVIDNVSPEAMKSVIEYCYTGNIDLREDFVIIVFNAAGFLQMTSLLKVCGEFLKTIVDVKNCFLVAKLAKLYSNADLEITAKEFIRFNFIELVSSKEFLEIEFTDVLDFLKCDDLNVSSETTVFRSVQRWVQHDCPNRQKRLCALLEFIKLPLLPIEIIFDEVQPLLTDGNGQSLVSDAIQWITIPNRRPNLNSHRNVPRKSGIVVLAIGDWEIGTSEIVMLYDPETNSFSEFMNLNTDVRNFRAVILEEEIIITSGYIGDSLTVINTANSYNIKTGSMKSLPPMLEFRNDPVVAVIGGFVYAVGGYNGSKCTNSVERFDSTSQTWTLMNSSPTARRDAGGVFFNDNKLYVIGGFDGTSCLNVVESYCHSTGKWKTCAPTTEVRRWPGVAVAGGLIYVVGGSQNVMLSSAERYDPKTDTWSKIANISLARHAIGVCRHGDNLIAYGGGADGITRTELEEYNPSTNEWRTLKNTVKRGHYNFIPVSKAWIKRIKPNAIHN